MRTVVFKFGWVIVVCCLTGASAVCSAVKSLDACLAERHIETDEKSLEAVVVSGQREDKLLAAAYMAEKGMTDSIPVIRGALWDEPFTDAGIQLAKDLVTLKDSAGAAFLNKVCHDSGLPDVVRLRAGGGLTETSTDKSCVATVMELIAHGDDAARLEGLGDFPALLSAGVDRTQLVAVARINSRDPNGLVKVQAFRALVLLKDSNIEAELTRVVAAEDDPSTREALNDVLSTELGLRKAAGRSH